MITVAFQSDTVRIQQDDKAYILSKANRLARMLNATDVECGIIFTNNQRIRTLNREYRNNDKVTDVLSFAMRDAQQFPAPSNFAETEFIGDIFVNIEFVRKRSRSKKETRDRMTFLCIHGLLHLFQYDHRTGQEVRRMRNIESKILGNKTFYDHDHH